MSEIDEIFGKPNDRIFKGPSDSEKAVYSMLNTDEGKVFLEWLRKRTIERQIGYGVADGIQTAILTSRELGRQDIYHELNQLLTKMKAYADRTASE